MAGRRIRIGDVWDGTVQVLSGRGGILATIAFLYVFLPNVVSAGVRLWLGTASAGAAVAGVAIALASLVALIFGLLALTAVASDPAVDLSRANAVAGARLGRTLLVMIVAAAAVIAIVLVPAVLFAMSGVTMRADGQVDLSAMRGGNVGLASVATIVAVAVALWLTARLVPLFPVIVNERLGVAALRRAFALSRGTAGRMIGVIILFGIVLLVVVMAVTLVVGSIAALLLGREAEGAIAFVVALASGAVTAAATVVQTVFYARFYAAALAARGENGGDVAPVTR